MICTYICIMKVHCYSYKLSEFMLNNLKSFAYSYFNSTLVCFLLTDASTKLL